MDADVPGKNQPKIKIHHTSTAGGGLWCAGWLFTIGYLHLGFWKAVFAIIVWPYFIGVHLAAIKSA